MSKAKKIKILNFLSAAVLVGLLGLVQFCSAANGGASFELQAQMHNAGLKAWGAQASPTSMAQIVKYAIQAFLGLLGIIFLILIIYAGFNWMTAQGDEDKVKTARDTLIRAIIGLAIIIAAYSITYFVFSSLPMGEGAGPTGSP